MAPGWMPDLGSSWLSWLAAESPSPRLAVLIAVSHDQNHRAGRPCWCHMLNKKRLVSRLQEILCCQCWRIATNDIIFWLQTGIWARAGDYREPQMVDNGGNNSAIVSKLLRFHRGKRWKAAEFVGYTWPPTHGSLPMLAIVFRLQQYSGARFSEMSKRKTERSTPRILTDPQRIIIEATRGKPFLCSKLWHPTHHRKIFGWAPAVPHFSGAARPSSSSCIVTQICYHGTRHT